MDDYLMTWEQVDELVQTVADECPGWWPFSVEWGPESRYRVKFTIGPGLSWVEIVQPDPEAAVRFIRDWYARNPVNTERAGAPQAEGEGA